MADKMDAECGQAAIPCCLVLCLQAYKREDRNNQKFLKGNCGKSLCGHLLHLVDNTFQFRETSTHYCAVLFYPQWDHKDFFQFMK